MTINALPDKPYPYVPRDQADIPPDKQAVFELAVIKSLEFTSFMRELTGGPDPLVDVALAKDLNELEPTFREEVLAQLRAQRAEKVAMAVLGKEGIGWLRRCLKGWRNFVYDGKEVPFVPAGEDGLCQMVNIDRIYASLRSELVHATMNLNKLEGPEKKKSE